MSAFRKGMKVFDVHILKNKNKIGVAMVTISFNFSAVLMLNFTMNEQ